MIRICRRIRQFVLVSHMEVCSKKRPLSDIFTYVTVRNRHSDRDEILPRRLERLGEELANLITVTFSAEKVCYVYGDICRMRPQRIVAATVIKLCHLCNTKVELGGDACPVGRLIDCVKY